MHEESDSCAGALPFSDVELDFDDGIQSLPPLHESESECGEGEDFFDNATEYNDSGDELEPPAPAPACSSPVPPADSLGPWRHRWRELLRHQAEHHVSAVELPLLLLEICKSVPSAFGTHFAALAGVTDDGGTQGTQGSTASPRRVRQRDLLPLPVPNISAEEMPSRNSNTHQCKSRMAARSAWLLLMVCVINFHYCLGKSSEVCGLHHGPAIQAQKAAHMRLAVAADAFCGTAVWALLLEVRTLVVCGAATVA